MVLQKDIGKVLINLRIPVVHPVNARAHLSFCVVGRRGWGSCSQLIGHDDQGRVALHCFLSRTEAQVLQRLVGDAAAAIFVPEKPTEDGAKDGLPGTHSSDL